MPRCFDDPFPVFLESDAEKPDDKRPTFWFRTLTLREWRDLKKTEGEDIDKAYALLEASLDKWTNIINRKNEEVPYVAGELEGIVNPNEAMELVGKLQLGYGDKKKLESPPSSSAESSAPPA